MQDTVTLQGDAWRLMGEFPRPVAESFRRLLERFQIPSVLRTPWQWVHAASVVEIEAGGFQGLVGLYVPEIMLEEALEVLGFDEEAENTG